MENRTNLSSKNVYELMVEGGIEYSWLTGFGEVEVHTERTGSGRKPTLFRIVTDQSGLVGLIRRVHGLGIVLLSVKRCQLPAQERGTEA